MGHSPASPPHRHCEEGGGLLALAAGEEGDAGEGEQPGRGFGYVGRNLIQRTGANFP